MCIRVWEICQFVSDFKFNSHFILFDLECRRVVLRPSHSLRIFLLLLHLQFLCQVAKTQTQLIIVTFVSQSAKSIKNQTRIGKFPRLCSSRLRIFHFNFARKNENWPQNSNFSFFFVFVQCLPIFSISLIFSWIQITVNFDLASKNPTIFDCSLFHIMSKVRTC